MERRITLLPLHKFDSSVLSGMWSDQVSVLANHSRRKSIGIKFVTAGFAENCGSRCSEHARAESVLVLESKYCRKVVEELV